MSSEDGGGVATPNTEDTIAGWAFYARMLEERVNDLAIENAALRVEKDRIVRSASAAARMFARDIEQALGVEFSEEERRSRPSI